MRRVLVIGSGGSGKSTLARRIGRATGLPVFHLDALYWRAGWTETPKAEWARRVEALVAEPVWVMDGNYGGTLDARLAAADTAIFLDLPRVVCLAGALRRWWRYRGRTRPDMAADCPERPTFKFLRWIWHYPRDRRPGVLNKLDAAAQRGVTVVRLRSRRQVDSYASSLERRATA